jgi:probable F420-dependent oxidoreductase
LEYWISWFHETNVSGEAKAVAIAAEELGFTGIALSDHVALPKVQQSRHPILGIPYDPEIPVVEPITATAIMAAVTEKLHFMTYAYVLGMREPFTVAKQAGALADLTDNRFALGMTPGWSTDEISLLGHDPATRGKRFVESIEVIQGLWQNDFYSYNGEHYQFENVGMAPRPATPPPIYVGGHSLLAIKRAVKQAGWIGMNHSVDELTPLLGQLRELSEGRARSYVIAAEEATPAYMDQLRNLGVSGVVFMPWPIMQQLPVSLDEKIEAMTRLAAQLSLS